MHVRLVGNGMKLQSPGILSHPSSNPSIQPHLPSAQANWENKVIRTPAKVPTKTPIWHTRCALPLNICTILFPWILSLNAEGTKGRSEDKVGGAGNHGSWVVYYHIDNTMF
jgi:hypothetical protein